MSIVRPLTAALAVLALAAGASGTAAATSTRGDRAFAAAAGVRLRTWPGGHDGAYWNRHYRDYLRFYARVLAHCAP
jgi:hypothetical protein